MSKPYNVHFGYSEYSRVPQAISRVSGEALTLWEWRYGSGAWSYLGLHQLGGAR